MKPVIAVLIDALKKPKTETECDEHQWVDKGGRECPMGHPTCQQRIYVCSNEKCRKHDFGQRSGPGHALCRISCGDNLQNWINKK